MKNLFNKVLGVTGLVVLALVLIGATVPLSKTLPRDANKYPLQQASALLFQDATGTPIVSPKTSVGTTAQAFVVPAGGVNMVFRGTAALRYGKTSTLDGSAGNGYRKASANSDVVYPCSNVTTLYIRAESGTVDVDFHFELLE